MRTFRMISEDMRDVLDRIQNIIDAMPDNPDNAEDAWQLFKVFQARDSLKAAYEYEVEVEERLRGLL